MLNFAMTEFSELRSKGVGLLLDHRLGWLGRGYGVRVSVHHLPLTLFGSKDHRGAHGVRGDLFLPADLGPGPLYLHHVGTDHGQPTSKHRGCFSLRHSWYTTNQVPVSEH